MFSKMQNPSTFSHDSTQCVIESWTFANTMTNQNFMEFPHNTVGLKYEIKAQFRDKVGFYLPQRFKKSTF